MTDPTNSALGRLFERLSKHEGPALQRADEVARPYDSLGTHPDLVARLWDELQVKLPADCRMVFFGHPALMHPATQVVFGFATGTHTYALRLPEPERTAAIQAGAKRVQEYPKEQYRLDLNEVGEEWVFCGWFHAEEDWCLAAYELAGRT